MASSKPVTCVVAFCDGNRGIGHQRKLPWPHLEEDFEFYTSFSVKTKDPAKKNGIIQGRMTWEGAKEIPKESRDPRRVTAVVSSSMCKDSLCEAVVPTFGAAVDLFNSPDYDYIENINVLGGSKIYEAAIADPRCTRLVITRVFQDFPADTFMPPFEHCFQLGSDPEIDGKVRENNGVKFRFEVWDRMAS